jgi:hypothetical protein
VIGIIPVRTGRPRRRQKLLTAELAEKRPGPAKKTKPQSTLLFLFFADSADFLCEPRG